MYLSVDSLRRGERIPSYSDPISVNPMRIQIAYVSARRDRLKSPAAHDLVQEYVARAAHFMPTSLQSFRSEEELLASATRRGGRTPPHLILLDSRGRAFTSEQFATKIAELRDRGTQDTILAIGPADGWSLATCKSADLLLSLGLMTLPHELALLVLTEQAYRALTILAGHPYHGGHE